MKRKDSRLAPAPAGSDELRPRLSRREIRRVVHAGLPTGRLLSSRRPEQCMRFSRTQLRDGLHPLASSIPVAWAGSVAEGRTHAPFSGRPEAVFVASHVGAPDQLGERSHDLRGRLLRQVKQVRGDHLGAELRDSVPQSAGSQRGSAYGQSGAAASATPRGRFRIRVTSSG